MLLEYFHILILYWALLGQLCTSGPWMEACSQPRSRGLGGQSACLVDQKEAKPLAHDGGETYGTRTVLMGSGSELEEANASEP